MFTNIAYSQPNCVFNTFGTQAPGENGRDWEKRCCDNPTGNPIIRLVSLVWLVWLVSMVSMVWMINPIIRPPDSTSPKLLKQVTEIWISYVWDFDESPRFVSFLFRLLDQLHTKCHFVEKTRETIILQHHIDFIPHQLDTRIRELSLVYLDMVVCEALTYQMMLQVLCISTCSWPVWCILCCSWSRAPSTGRRRRRRTLEAATARLLHLSWRPSPPPSSSYSVSFQWQIYLDSVIFGKAYQNRETEGDSDKENLKEFFCSSE